MSTFDDSLFVDREKKYRGFQKLLQPDTRQAVMLIEAEKDMGKTWLVGKMQGHCLQPAIGVPIAHLDFRNPREMHDIQNFLGVIRLLRDKLDTPSYFNKLNATINSFTAGYAGANPGLVGLRDNIETYFNLEELEDLCFDLGIKYDNLPGETLYAKARELVVYCERRGILPQLIRRCAELRKAVDWWQGLEAHRATETADSPTPPETADTLIKDDNAPLRAESNAEREHAERQINNVFFECLETLLADKKQVVCFFDSVEDAPYEAERWLLKQLLPRMRDGQAADLVVIITGRKTPDVSDLEMRHLIVQTGLEPFTEAHIREYFVERRKIADLDFRTITVTSGGVPGALAMMADHATLTSQKDDDFFSDL